MSRSRLIDAIRSAQAGLQPARAAATPSIDPKGKRVLLVYLFSGLGDAALLTPIITALYRAGAEVGVLVRPLGKELLRWVDLPLRLHVLGTRGLARELRAARYDVAIDLTLRSDVDARRWLIAPLRFGWLAAGERTEESGLDHGAIDTRHHTDRHWSRALVPPLSPLGVTAPDYEVPWRTTATRWRSAESRWGPRRAPRILLVPGSRSDEKRWSAERYASITGKLVERSGARVIVSGAPWERSELRSIAKGIGGAVYAGKDLGELLALVAGADLVLSNDTGPIHLAYLLGVPTVGVYTTMSPLAWGPHVKDPRWVIRRWERGSTGELERLSGELVEGASRLLEGAGSRRRPKRLRVGKKRSDP